jgi:hypothetical protein
MACTGPTSLAAAAAGCVQPPPCAVVSCYRNLLCLIYDTTAHVLAGCRSPNDGTLLYCVCAEIENTSTTKMSFNASANNFTLISEPTYSTTALFSSPPVFAAGDSSTISHSVTTSHSSGIGGGAIAGIVIGVLIILALIAVGAFFAVRKIRERRKNHGEYRPQWEEYQHAKDLPYLPPPAIEGLI